MSRLVVLFFAVRFPRPPPGIIDAADNEDEDEEKLRVAVACDVRRSCRRDDEEDVNASTVMWLVLRLITATPNSATSKSRLPPVVVVLQEAATARRR